MLPMYEGKAFSPVTTLSRDMSPAARELWAEDGTVFPPPPCLATLGSDSGAETILYETLEGNRLSGITRAVEGEARFWKAGTSIGRCFTHADYSSLVSNLQALDSEKISGVRVGEITLSEDGQPTVKVDRAGPEAVLSFAFPAASQQDPDQLGQVSQVLEHINGVFSQELEDFKEREALAVQALDQINGKVI